MKARYQRGALRLVQRTKGKIWLLRFRTIRDDGKRVEHGIAVGWLKDLPTRKDAWDAVERKRLTNTINNSITGRHPITFGELARHYLANELPEDQSEATMPKDHSTAVTYRRYLNRWVLPRWEEQGCLSVEPLEVERWFKDLGKRRGLDHPTRSKIRLVMNLVYRHGIRYGLLPRIEEANPIKWVRQSSKSSFEPVILTLPQAFDILEHLDLRMRTMVLVAAATGLRISEILALRWREAEFARQQLMVRRKYVYGQFGEPKSKASKAPVPLHPILAAHLQLWREETPYAKDDDLIFPSLRLKGKKPPAANMLVADHLRPAAEKAGVTAPPRAFGFHTFRRTLATVLVANNVDPKVVQEALRHQGIRTTLELYAKTITANKVEAQGLFLNLLFDEAERGQRQQPQPPSSLELLEKAAVVTRVLQ